MKKALLISGLLASAAYAVLNQPADIDISAQDGVEHIATERSKDLSSTVSGTSHVVLSPNSVTWLTTSGTATGIYSLNAVCTSTSGTLQQCPAW